MKEMFTIKKFSGISAVVLVTFLLSVSFLYAQTPNIGVSGPKLTNPIGTDSLFQFLEFIIDALIKIAVPVASIVIMFAGFKFVMARGNSSELDKAKELLWGALIGIALILISKVLITVLQTTIERLQL